MKYYVVFSVGDWKSHCDVFDGACAEEAIDTAIRSELRVHVEGAVAFCAAEGDAREYLEDNLCVENYEDDGEMTAEEEKEMIMDFLLDSPGIVVTPQRIKEVFA